MKTLIKIINEIWKEKKQYFNNIDFYAQKIKRMAQEILGEETKVFLFGSILKKTWTVGSDIDILIISDNLPDNFDKRNEIRTKIKSKISPFSPFQIHLVTNEEFEKWYKNFVKKDILNV